MTELTESEFLQMKKANKIFVFSLSSCLLCKHHKEAMKDLDVHYVTIDHEEVLENLNIVAVPTTVIFDIEEKIKFKKYGIFFDEQKTQMLEAHKKILERIDTNV